MATLIEEDYYYSHPCRDFLATDEALRIRVPTQGKPRITYKGPRLPGAGLKERMEIEVEAPPELQRILEALGFYPTLTVRKTRSYYRLGKAKITLDEVEGLGCFIEVEAGDEKTIKSTLLKIGVTGPLIHESYAELLAKRRHHED